MNYTKQREFEGYYLAPIEHEGEVWAHLFCDNKCRMTFCIYGKKKLNKLLSYLERPYFCRVTSDGEDFQVLYDTDNVLSKSKYGKMLKSQKRKNP